jgi:osmoprotectant transport system substrate-binding protein
MRWHHRLVVALGAASLVPLLACTAGGDESVERSALDDDAITVASFDFQESVVLAEVYSRALENAGYRVDRRLGLGPREFVAPALTAGLVELVPEYAGTALEFVSLGATTATSDAAATHEELARFLDDGDVMALAAAPAQNANTFVVTAETAARLDLDAVSDLAAVAGTLTFGGPAECATRRLCLVGLAEVYGVTFGDVQALDPGGPLTRQALRNGEIDVALLFTTDPAIEREGFVELADDRNLQPAENVTPFIRSEVVERWGDDVVRVIDAVSRVLTTDAVRRLNAAATGEPGSGDAATVAAEWLRSVAAT